MLLPALLALPASAATLQVGPGKPYATPCAAISAAQPGDVIEIDAAGNYSGNVCGWTKSNLTLRGVNGRPRIDAAGRNSQGKAIWVISGNDTTVENIEFSGATVVDHNGAGIRAEGTNLTIRRCYFHDNENGILASPNAASQILIEFSEFGNNGYGDGYSHNMYINAVAKFTLRYSYSHHAKVGHLVKSRAAENNILYNRLTNEAGGTASYELDLPNGGRSYVIGNLIQQSNTTGNPGMLAYLMEGSTGSPRDLYVVNNTFVNDKGSGTFVLTGSAATTPAIIKNNLFVGGGTVTTQSGAVLAGNMTNDPGFVNRSAYDYHLQSNSTAINKGVDPGTGSGRALTPDTQYVHPTCAETRTSVGVIDIGAYEYGSAGTSLCGSTNPSDTTAPVISGVTAGSVSVSGTVITWSTNEAADTQLDYGTSTSYGATTPLDSAQVTAHSVALSGLSAGTLYHYRVRSRDAAGNLAVSSDFTFSTTSGTAPFTPIRINTGGSAYTDPSGTVWSADQGFDAGAIWTNGGTVANTNASPLYQDQRYSYAPLTYRFNVPNGSYTVTLKFAELSIETTGQRLFHADLNGQRVLTNFDVYAAAGGPLRAIDKSFPVTVSGGQIYITFTAAASSAIINAIEIR